MADARENVQKFLDQSGLSHLWTKIKEYVADNSIDSVSWGDISNKPDVALKSDLTNVYIYRGTKPTYAQLPTTGNVIGDVWNVEDSDMNYAWTGTTWDPLGQTFTVDAMTDADIDAICT